MTSFVPMRLPREIGENFVQARDCGSLERFALSLWHSQGFSSASMPMRIFDNPHGPDEDPQSSS